MDEQVKARLIGATVLVAIAVALVPELLSGPKHGTGPGAADPNKGTRTVVIDLGGAVASGARVQTAEPAPTPAREPSRLTPVDVPGENVRRDDPAAEEAPTVEPARPAATVAASEPMAPPVVAPASVAKPATTRGTKTTATSGTGGWAVQVGAFGSAESARKLVGELKKDGLSAYVAPLERNGKTLHRVRVGPAATRAEADKLAVRIKGRGLPASVVAPD
ncbi:MAG TPA: SPOR domain-containing protein [Steroidobacteraceae bacterium]|nr:SPOR domain-containing protein [Steroidobacteraceae bacterium]